MVLVLFPTLPGRACFFDAASCAEATCSGTLRYRLCYGFDVESGSSRFVVCERARAHDCHKDSRGRVLGKPLDLDSVVSGVRPIAGHLALDLLPSLAGVLGVVARVVLEAPVCLELEDPVVRGDLSTHDDTTLAKFKVEREIVCFVHIHGRISALCKVGLARASVVKVVPLIRVLEPDTLILHVILIVQARLLLLCTFSVLASITEDPCVTGSVEGNTLGVTKACTGCAARFFLSH
mmetsp:Transcript_19387/g.34541  ORF Transcript_19387/g.34541 Transcript_19387/m.34541 type:complete len:236 (-) Transcript_19387:503-1210(-)